MNRQDVDPVTLTVVWNRLVSITDEMGSALRRTAFSEAVREGEDFSTGLFDRQGRLIAQGNFTPGHLGAMPYAVENALRFIPPETLGPGDMLATNDSFLGGGHFPDIFLIAPIFEGASLLGYLRQHRAPCRCRRRAAGVGGGAGRHRRFRRGAAHPADQAGEGRRVRLRPAAGHPGQCPHPREGRGDLLAQRNANHLGAQRFGNCSPTTAPR